MRINGRKAYMYAYTGNAPENSFARTAALISEKSPSRTLTHALLRDSSAAICPTASPRTLRSSAMNAACSRMLSARSFAIRKKAMIPPASSVLNETYGTPSQAQLPRAPPPLKPVEQDPRLTDPLQRLLDPPRGDRRQQSRFERPLFQPAAALVAHVQRRDFHAQRRIRTGN